MYNLQIDYFVDCTVKSWQSSVKIVLVKIISPINVILRIF